MTSVTTKHYQSLRCDQCDLSFNSYGTLCNHKNAFHMGIYYKCDNCAYSSKYKNGLQKHIETQHIGVTHPCETCGKVYSQAGSLERHRATVHEGMTFRCEYCSHDTRRKSELLEHKAFIHLKGTIVKCQICDKRIPRQSLLKVHMRVQARLHSAAHSVP